MPAEDLMPPEELFRRKLVLPNGETCYVEMAGWYWTAMDYIQSIGSWDSQKFIRLAWGVAKKAENSGYMDRDTVLNQFSESLAYAIWKQFEYIKHKDKGVANDA